jgi:RHS repeat-associated protein
MDRGTPALAVIDPCGAPIRAVVYWRQSALDAPQARITQTILDRHTRTSHSRDPRLFSLFKSASAPANQTTLTSLSGASMLSVNVDAGWRLSLTGASGQPLESWDQKLSHRRVVHDALLRPAFLFEQEAGEALLRSECYDYADGSPESAQHNLCGQIVRHDDRGGTVFLHECSLSGSALEQSRRFLQALDAPDWPEDEIGRDNLLEPERALTRTDNNAAGEQIRHVDALGNEQLLRQTRAGELSETCLKLHDAAGFSTLVGNIRYNAEGQIEQQTAGNGVVTRATFDAENGRLSTLITQNRNQSPIQNLTYAYDPVGNLLSISDSAQPIRYFRNQRVAPLNTYRYDSLYQLIEASGRQCVNTPGGPLLPEFISPPDSSQLENYRQTFAYDSGGNLLTLQHVADSGQRSERTAVAAASNRSLPYSANGEPPGEGEINAGYDPNGNLKLLQQGQSLLWNGRDQLCQVDQVLREGEPNDSERYVYDGAGQRLRKIRTAYSSRRTRTHETRYLPGVEIRTAPEETVHVISVQAGRCTVQILHWEKGRPAHVADDQHRYLLTDHLASSSLELDVDAQLISQESFYPYGGTAWWAGRDKVEAGYRTLRYSGQERDATGLYYYGFRYYMPWRQRWLSADPAGVSEGLNLYQMVGGNPIGFVDFQGLAKTRVNWPERAKAMPSGIARGIVKGSAGYGFKYVAKQALNATIGPYARWLAAGMSGAAGGYAAAGLTAHALQSAGVTGRRKMMAVGAMGVAGSVAGFAGGFLSSDPIGTLSDVAKDLGGVLTGRVISPLGPSITYDGNATLASQAVNIATNLAVNFVEGMWLGGLKNSDYPLLRSAGNGALKSFVGDAIRSTDVVPASYNESKHSAWSLPTVADGKTIAKTFAHDTAMSSLYGFGNDAINRGIDIGLTDSHVDPTLRGGFGNLQVVNELDAIVGEKVLSGMAWHEVNAIPNETTTKASTARNQQAAEDKRMARSRRRHGIGIEMQPMNV